MAAKRRSTIRRTYRTVRRSYRKAAGFGGGKFGPIIQGAIAGVASSLGGKFLPGYGSVLGIGATGYFMNNPTLLTLAGMQAGAMVTAGFTGSTTNGGSSGGFI